MGILPSDALTESVRALLRGEYGLKSPALSHLATHSNILYRVDTADGRRMVLRVATPGSNTRPNLEIEVAWLRELVSVPELQIAAPIPTPDRRFVTEVVAEGQTRSCVLFSWVPGGPLGDGAGTSGYRAMGRVSALLHEQGDWRPTDPSILRRWDRTFYYSPEVEAVIIDDFRFDHLFTGIRGSVREAARICDAAILQAWERRRPMVVHGDLHEWNVHIHRGRAWAIDFEDVMLALPAQDVAVSLYGARIRPDLNMVVEAFRSGYEEHRTWPVSSRLELETYWAARQAMLMNHAAMILPEAEALDYFGKVMPWLEGFLTRARHDERLPG